MASGPGTPSANSTFQFASWNRLDTVTLHQPRPEALWVLYDWLHDESERGPVVPMLVLQALSLDWPDIRHFAQYARVELAWLLDPALKVF